VQVEDRVEFLKVMNGMAGMKKLQLTTDILDLWWTCMKSWEIGDFKAAAAHLLTKCEFMPQPKDFEDLRKAGRPSAGEAWAKVLDHVRKGWYRYTDGGVGRYERELAPNEALINSAVEAIGGYRAIAIHQESTLHFLERRFCEHYESIQDREEVRTALPGIAKRPDWLQLQVDEAQKKLTQT
jgi:hypothetical protein